MKRYIGFLMAGVLITLFSCKKESPIEDLGQAGQNGAYKASLRVTLNDRNPLAGNDIVVTATTWHINDEIEKVEFYETAVEKYTVNLELANTELNNWKSGENPVFLVADSLSKNVVWKTVSKNELNGYFQTVADAYVIRGVYDKFKPVNIEGADLINSLSDLDFKSLKSSLSNQIAVSDYKLLFPTAPSTDFSGLSLTAAGKLNLVNNLTKSILINNGLKSAAKVGELITDIKVVVTAKNDAISEVSNKFQAKY